MRLRRMLKARTKLVLAPELGLCSAFVRGVTHWRLFARAVISVKSVGSHSVDSANFPKADTGGFFGYQAGSNG